MKYSIIFTLLFAHSIALFGQSKFDQNTSVEAATAFLKVLSPTQKLVANLPLEDTSRVKWSNLPSEQVLRKGVQMADLADSQRLVVHSLLRTVLSQQGYQKFLFIIQYDEATHERLEKSGNPIAKRYGNQNYWLSIFGTPKADQVWGWKFEGHHISLNMTYSPKGVTCTPMFVGINPALATSGPYAGSHLMYEENDLGNQLFNSFNDVLKQKARISEHPKDADVMTQKGNEPHLKDKAGVSYAEMNPAQQIMVEKIIRAWVENLAPALAKEKMERILQQKNNLVFTWQGSFNTKELHYYSIKTNSFIIEFTNRDGGIYHYHTLWRDLTEDYQGK